MEQQGRERVGCAPSARTEGQGATGSPEAARLAATIARRRAQDAERERLASDRKRRRRREARDKAKRALRLGSASSREVDRVMKFAHYNFDMPWPEADPDRGLPKLSTNHRLLFQFVLGCRLAGFLGVHTSLKHIGERLNQSKSTVQLGFRRLALYGLVVPVDNYDPDNAKRYGLPANHTRIANTYRLGDVAGEALLSWVRQQMEHRDRCKAGPAPAPERPSRRRPAAPSSPSSSMGEHGSAHPYKRGENHHPLPTVDKIIESTDPAKVSAPPTDPGAKAPSRSLARAQPAPLARRRLTRAGGARSGPPPEPPARPANAPPGPQRDVQPWRTAWRSALCAFEKRRTEPPAPEKRPGRAGSVPERSHLPPQAMRASDNSDPPAEPPSG